MRTNLESTHAAESGVALALALVALSLACVSQMQAAVIICTSPSPQSQLAAREVQRYIYLRTGRMLTIREGALGREEGIVLGKNNALGTEQFRLRSSVTNGHKVLRIEGGSDLATLYGAYRFAETLGVRFELEGDVIPDDRIRFAIPDLDETHAPLFETRGIQPFHDFTEGPDWWSAGDYKAYFAQMAKLRLNFAGFHCYPEGGVGPEPLVWIGLPEDVNEDGTVKFSYPSRWASTVSGGAWGYATARTSEFAAGAGLLFPGDEFGSPVSDGLRPLPKGSAEANAVFDRTGAFLRDTFSFGRVLGVRTCIGTETPLHIPEAVRQHLREKGLEATNAVTIQKLYEGMFKRIARTHPLDNYWLWTPEDWTWGGNKPEQYAATLADIRAAQGALDTLGNPFRLATCGWVLGPQHDRAAFDRDLPRTSPMSCINRQVGFDFVDPAFSRIEGRPKWAIPWLEDDPELVAIQLYSGRMRRDAADAQAYGCTGLLGIHWRTRILSPNLVTLAQAAWDQRGWNPESGRRLKVELRTEDVRVGGQVAGSDAGPQGRPRDLACADFYADWAQAQFGPEVGEAMGRLFTSVDGGAGDYSRNTATRLPRPADWINGPGGIRANPRPWSEVQAGYAIVGEIESLRAQVKGAGNLERFDYWLNSFRYHRALGELGCLRGQLDNLMKQAGQETDPAKRKQMAGGEILPVRLALARRWEQMMTLLLQTVSTPGEMGTIANLEQHTRRNDHFLDAHDAKLSEFLGAPLPAGAQPGTVYTGPARLLVPTQRSVVLAGEVPSLRAILLDRNDAAAVTLLLRPLGKRKFTVTPMKHLGRGVYEATLPRAGSETLEYAVRAKLQDGRELYWPATAPERGATLVSVPAGQGN